MNINVVKFLNKIKINKNSVIVIIAVALLIFSFIRTKTLKISSNDTKNLLSFSNSASLKQNFPANQIDSDNDGLPDWLEILLGSDPHNSDTNKDGYKDGESYFSGRHPLTGDKIKKQEANTDLIFSNASNITEKMAYAIAQTINSGGLSSLNSQKEADVLSILNKANTSKLLSAVAEDIAANYPYISDKEIKLSDNNSSLAINSYIKNIKTVLKTSNKAAFYLKDDSEKKEISEAELVARSISENYFDMLVILANNTNEAINMLKAMQVPSKFSQLHKDLLSFYIFKVLTIEDIMKIEKDPIKGYAATAYYYQIFVPESPQYQNLTKQLSELIK